MNFDRKRTEEGKNLNQNKVCEKVARYVCGVSLLLTLFPIQLADRLTGLTKENFEHNGSTIKYLKSPSVDAGDFQIKQMLQKMQLSLTERSDLNIRM